MRVQEGTALRTLVTALIIFECGWPKSFASSDVTDAFEIDSRRGVIRTRAPLDRERVSTFTIPVVARDNGSVPTQRQCRVVVQVRDVNDNDPAVDVFLNSGDEHVAHVQGGCLPDNSL